MHKVIKLLWFAHKTGAVLVLLLFNQYNLSAHYQTQNEKILICGVGKNIGHCIPNMKQKIEALGLHFKDYRVIIYENNSQDNTVQLLHEWARSNPRVVVISELLSPEELYNRTKSHALSDKAPCRMELIAYARNQVLQEALKNEYADYTFVFMSDLDFRVGWDVDGVLSCFTIDTEWDALMANSLVGGSYYDRYAYRDEQFPLGPELLGETFWRDLSRFPISFSPNTPLKKVYSAFGGAGVYKRDGLKGCVYSGSVTPDFEQFMRNVLDNLPQSLRQYQQYRGIVGKSDSLPIKFQANSGYDQPVVCEHCTLHASMILRGRNKIYVNPRMRCVY